ncbi:putative Tau-tubulin kinase 2 [Blattamonas nauphoetae]|uniref:Tau-tubulin kinase 2 n=1 Tax=Blattamonas nauphoetae TaxID=2049346 RepID=A0ABQ9XUD2_9EUKA|nr:putative Tau-tubulin kinase 2 [Blattamonas nauphoetae]
MKSDQASVRGQNHTENVALKVENNRNQTSTLDSEASILQDLDGHKYFPRIFGKGVSRKGKFLVMELLGENLKTLLSRFSPGRVLPNIQRHYALEMLNCIEALHSRGWIHCDITPWHFVERNRSARNGHLVLVGFGKAERHDSSPLFNEVPTVRTFQGTAKYGSSHVIVGGEGSFRDDLWSWFFIVLEMKVGHLPWSGEESLSEMARIREEWEHQMRLHSLPPRASSILDPSDVAHPTRSNMPNTTQTSLPYTFPPHSTVCADDSEQPGHFQIERKNTEIDENLVLIFRHLADLKFGEKPNYSLLRQLLQREWAVHVPPMGLDHSSSNELDASPFSSFRASDNSRMEISLSHGRLLEIHSPFGSNSRTTRDGENPNAEERHSEAGKMQRSTSCDTHLKMEKDDETATSPKHHTTFHTFDLAHPLLRTPTVCGACVGSSARLWFGEERIVAGPQPLLRLVRRLLAASADSARPTRSVGVVVVTSIPDSVIADTRSSFSTSDSQLELRNMLLDWVSQSLVPSPSTSLLFDFSLTSSVCISPTATASASVDQPTPIFALGKSFRESPPHYFQLSPSPHPLLFLSPPSSPHQALDESDSSTLGFQPLAAAQFFAENTQFDVTSKQLRKKSTKHNINPSSSSPSIDFSQTSIVYLPSMSVMDQQTSMMSWAGEEAGRVSEWIGTGEARVDEWKGLSELKEGKRRKGKKWRDEMKLSSCHSFMLPHTRLSLNPIGSSRSVCDVSETSDTQSIENRTKNQENITTNERLGDDEGGGEKESRDQQTRRWEEVFEGESDDERDVNSTHNVPSRCTLPSAQHVATHAEGGEVGREG